MFGEYIESWPFCVLYMTLSLQDLLVVRFVKDIKNAILAADIIVNEWGFTDYQLDIYGDTEKAPAYSVECKEILASKSLRDYVTLKGLGSPSKVLEEAVSLHQSPKTYSPRSLCLLYSGFSSIHQSPRACPWPWEKLH